MIKPQMPRTREELQSELTRTRRDLIQLPHLLDEDKKKNKQTEKGPMSPES